jgi:glyoxylase-like metal-dependent hydrolase (beta-lactamase superfamily II)
MTLNIRTLVAPNPGPFTLDGTRTYLLGSTAVIDPGPRIDSHVEAIADAMPELRSILITHRHADHAPAAIPLRARTGARILAPFATIEGEPVERQIAGGERIDIEGRSLEVIATPGHTREHVCFLTADGDLFTGDTILGAGTTAIFPPDGDMRDYLESLALLRSRSPRRIFPAHGPERSDALALIDQYIAHRQEREKQIVAALHACPASIPQLRSSIYPQVEDALAEAADVQLLAHLIKLRTEGRVIERDGVYRLS